MAVLFIVGILMALVFGISGYAAQAAKKGKAKSQIQEIAGFLQDHITRTGVYPDSLDAITNRLPAAFRRDSTGHPLDPWSQPYRYDTNSPYSFRLFSGGPDGTNGTTDDIELGK